MRVLDIDNNYSPTGGGVRTYHDEKLAWFRAQPEHAYGFVVPSDRSEVVRDGNVTVFHVPAVPLGSSGYRMIVRRRPLASLLKSFAPDVVEVGSPYVLPRLLARTFRRMDERRRPATVGFYHSDVPDTLVRPLASRLGLRAGDAGTDAATRWIGKTYAGMTAMFGASEFVLQKLSDAGVERLFHTPLGVDTDAFGAERRDDAWRATLGADGKALVLYLARLSAEKGVRDLFEAYPLFRDPERVQLVVVGHGPLQSELDGFVARFPEVRTAGFMADRADVARAYASADVFLSLGNLETFSLSTAEALASGVPTVAPRGGGAGEQVARVSPELIFDAGDAASLSDAVRRALAFDRRARQALTRSSTARRSWADVFAHETECYARIVAAHRDGDLAALRPPGSWWPVAA